MQLEIAELTVPDLSHGFLEALESLAKVQLTPEEAVAVLDDRRRAGIRTYVARSAGSVVGTASLLIERKFIHRGGRTGHIEDVAVHRQFQRQGIGTALVAHLTKEAQKLGCYKVILNCFEPLVPFYARLGYRRHESGLRIDF